MHQVRLNLSQATFDALLELVQGSLQSLLPDSEGVTDRALLELAEREGNVWAISKGRNAAAAIMPGEVLDALAEPEEDAADIATLANAYRELIEAKGGAA